MPDVVRIENVFDLVDLTSGPRDYFGCRKTSNYNQSFYDIKTAILKYFSPNQLEFKENINETSEKILP